MGKLLMGKKKYNVCTKECSLIYGPGLANVLIWRSHQGEEERQREVVCVCVCVRENKIIPGGGQRDGF